MCCLFGIYNYSGKEIKNFSKVTNSLAREATIRGMDATGIAYNHKGNLLIHKEAKSAYSIRRCPLLLYAIPVASKPLIVASLAKAFVSFGKVFIFFPL